MAIEKIVVVTRKTRLEELVERLNTRDQARFYIEHAGLDFADYEHEDATYRRALAELRRSLDLGLKLHFIDRSFVPTFLFSDQDLVVTAGQDGLVANCAKYVGSQPIVAVNPDPERFDGVLLPFAVAQARAVARAVIAGSYRVRPVTLAEVALNDGQRLLAFNDIFVGPRSHISLRYSIRIGDRSEAQSSSGVLVSTGAGSTGWLSSVFNMAEGIAAFAGGAAGKALRLAWEDPRLVYVVREPFASKYSRASIVAGLIEPGQDLILESLMPQGGVIFSDGIEADFLAFNSGAIGHIRAAAQQARLVVA